MVIDLNCFLRPRIGSTIYMFDGLQDGEGDDVDDD